METLVIHPESDEQQRALQTILDGFKVPYEKEPISEATQYLTSTKANQDRLNKALEEYKAGGGVEIKTDDLWK